MTLSPKELQRFQQQIHLPEVAEAGQLRLKNAKVACIGAGGLGSALLLYLTRAGVGTLGIIDDDKVELSNLHRQVLFQENDINHSKAQCAAEKLSSSQIHVYQTRLTISNAESILKDYDIIADCSDNFATKFLLNDICYLLDKPLVSASIFRFQGQCMMFHGRRGPCLRCLFPVMPNANEFMNCEEAGVMNVLPGLFGILQAAEIIKWILQQGDLLIGRVLAADILAMQFREYALPKNPDCELCVNHRIIHDIYTTSQCKRGANNMPDFIITPHELHELMQKNADIQLLDVRTIEKHKAYNIGGKHIPTAELADRLNELDPNKLVVTYCSMGGNSMRALQLLLSKGFRSVKSLEGGMTAWQKEIKS